MPGLNAGLFGLPASGLNAPQIRLNDRLADLTAALNL
jgi:hypothetical protein